METLALLKAEIKIEYETTKKFFTLFPEEKIEYAPHEKSMKLMPLASHISDIFGWPKIILNTEVLDFVKDNFSPAPVTNATQLQKKLQDNYDNALSALNKISEKDLEPGWRLENNGQLITSWTKYGAIRHALNQITHHRAQLGIYYRLLNIPLPGSYGPSADDQTFT